MKFLRILAISSTVAAILLILGRLAGGGVAPVPEVFKDRFTLADAIARSRTEHRPVFLFASADWGGPCQVMKRTFLSDCSIELHISRDFVPVYLNVDENQDVAAQFKIFSIPATIILWDGKLVAQMEGVVPHDSYEQWLLAAKEQALSDHPFLERASDEFKANLERAIEANRGKADSSEPSGPGREGPPAPPR